MIDENFDIAQYLIKRALESENPVEARTMFLRLSSEELASHKDECEALRIKFLSLFPTLFDFSVERDDYEGLFLAHLTKAYLQRTGICSVTTDRKPHQIEYYLTRAKQDANKWLEIIEEKFDADEIAPYQAQISAIENLFPNKRQSVLDDRVSKKLKT